MAKLRCPGMNPANFEPDDIKLHGCVECGEEIEFWKDDVRLDCPACGRANFNPDIGATCLAWCKSAVECVGNDDIKEWLKRYGDGRSDACDVSDSRR